MTRAGALPLLLVLALARLAAASTSFQLGSSQVTDAWTTVLTDSVVNPVVVAKGPTYNEADPCVPQVRNVAVGSFQIRLVEPHNEDGPHAAETVAWAVVSEGTQTVNGMRVDAGKVVSNSVAASSGTQDVVTFGSAFDAKPYVMATTNTLDAADRFVHVRLDGVTTTQVRFGMEREEDVYTSQHGTETTGWVAFEAVSTSVVTSSGVLIMIEALITPDSVTGNPYTVTFSDISTDTGGGVLALTQAQTLDGWNPCWVRQTHVAGNQVDVWCQECTTNDAETTHTSEIMGALMMGCGYRELQLGTPTGPVDNTDVAGVCPQLHYRAEAGWGDLPWVALSVATSGASIPLAYGSATETMPTAASHDVKDETQASATIELVLVNPDPDGVALMLESALQYEATVTMVEPVASTVGVMDAQWYASENNWVLLEFRPPADYQYVDFTARSGDGSALEMYLLRGALPSRNAYDQDDLTESGGEYSIHLLSPDTLTDYYVGVYTASNATNAVWLEARPAAPNLLGLSPTFGNTGGGYIVTMSGQNLGDGVSVTVDFDGEPCDDVTFSGGNVLCTVPEGDGTDKHLSVSHYGVQSNTQKFSFNAPTISSATVPAEGDNLLHTVGGDEILVEGTNFGLAGNLTINGLECPTTSYSHTEMRCSSSEGQGLAESVQIEVNGQISNIVLMAFKRPTISSRLPLLTPTQGGPLTLYGVDFGIGGDSSVTIGGVDCPITAHNHTQVVCDAPAGQGTGHSLVLTVASQTSVNPSALTVSYEPPVVAAVEPSSGPTTGQVITVTGTGFGSSGSVPVGGGGDTCAPSFYNDTMIVCEVPEGESTGLAVRVTVSGQTSNSEDFSYDAPALVSVWPSPGDTPGGVPLTVTGTSFGLSGTASVGGLNCPVTFRNHTAVVCTLPEGSGASNDVALTAGGQAGNNTLNFAYHAPAILSLSLDNATTEGGETLTLTGTNFAATGGVTVGGSVCTVTGAGYDHAVIECLVPEGQGAGREVVVTAGGQSSAAALLDYLPPAIASISPSSIPTEGGLLTVAGTNLGVLGAVLVDGNECVTVDWDHDAVQCTAPVGRGLMLNVTLAVGGQSDAVHNFNYSAPSISGITAGGTGFVTSGGSLLTVSGSSFDTNGTVTVDGEECPHDVTGGLYSHTEVRCLLPEGQGEGAQVLLTAESGRTSGVATFDYDPPVVSTTGATPDAPTEGGTNLTISGINLGINDATVLVNGIDCPILSQTHTLIRCSLPEGYGTDRLIQVTVGGQAQTGATILFSYDAPELDSVSPDTAPTEGGINITLEGRNFGAAGTVAVGVGAADCPVVERNHTHLVCTLPSGSGSEVVRVTVSGQQSGTMPFLYDAPTISTALPADGPTAGGTTLTLSGTSFGLTGTVLVGGRTCGVTLHNHTHVECTLPSGSGAGKEVTLTVDGQQSNAAPFAYRAPSLEAVSPASGTTAGGTVLTVTGQDFGTAGFATVGGQQCVLVPGEYNHTAFECTVPEGSGANLEVSIVVSEQESNALNFSYLAPEITAATPAGGATDGGSTLTLTGTNFGASGTVLVGGSPCPTASASAYGHSTIRCALPEGQGSVQIYVITGGQTSPAEAYTYAAPTISSVEPLTGATDGGDTLTVQGANFGVSGDLTVGGRVCNSSEDDSGVYSHDRIECPMPHGSGAGNLVELTVGGQSTFFGLGTYDYDVPAVSSVTPSSAATNGTIAVTVAGANFGVLGAIVATIGGTNCTAVSSRDHSSFECTLAEGVGAPLDVVVTVDGQTSAAASVFGYDAPSITSVSSAGCLDAGSTTTECPTAGGVLLTVTGHNFGPNVSASISVEDTTCTDEVHDLADPHHVVYCTLQAGLGFDKALAVTVGGQVSNAVLISYQVPVIDDVSLHFSGEGAASSITADDTAGGQTVAFTGRYFGATPTVKYGLAGGEYADLEYTCTVDSGASTTTYIECDIQSGVGEDLVFIVHDGLQESPPSADTLSYPAPVVLASSIRDTLEGDGTTLVSGSRSEGEDIYFDAQHVGTDKDLLQVHYGPSGGPYTYECTQIVLTAAATNTTIKCKTAPGDGTNYVFQITALNAVSAEGTDQYSYPLAPIVSRVVGCTDVASSNETVDCPTAGGNRLTITGEHFSASISVKIGANDCLDVSKTSSTEVECELPPGAGLDKSVLVVSGELFSRQNSYVSYALPTLTAITGCETDSGNNTEECSRYGAETLTLTGANFGADSATVLIGGELCGNVTHSAGDPHGELTCETPTGTQLSRAVLLIQSQGEISEDRLSVSYRQCAAGYYDASTDVSSDLACTACDPGSFTSSEGQDACTSCEAGFYAPDSNMTSCLKCLKGTYSVRVDGDGATECTECTAGRFTSADAQDACLPCPAGTYGTTNGSTTCEDCPAGTENADTAQTACTNCTAGNYAAEQRTLVCDQCPSGTFSGADGASVCEQCSSGTFADSPAATACEECALGTATASTGQASCVPCDSGFFSNVTGLDSCLACPAGYVSQKVGAAGPTACTPCESGEYIGASGQVVCLLCAKGNYQPETGQSTCEKCSAGTHATLLGATACDNCTAGTAAATEGAVTCSSCGAGTFSAADGATACDLCEAGTYQASSDATSCDPCEAGEAVASLGQPACTPCDVGFYTPGEGHETCLRCAAGRVAGSAGSSRCDSCDPGDFSESEAQGVCKECPVGTYSELGNSTACVQCEAGTVAGAAGSTECTNCTAGWFSPAPGGQTCERCPAGRYQDQDGQSACLGCEAGRAQADTNQADCDECAIGRYSSSTDQALCLVCPTGTFSNVTGSSECHECPPGKFQDSEEQDQCVDCPAGRFTSSSRQPVCVACPVGTFGAVDGLSACEGCAVGTHADSAESTRCTNCTAGHYSDEEGSIVCKDCAAGTVNDADGQSACDACEPGTFQASPAQTACELCGTGTAQPSYGQASCPDCLVGLVAPTEGLDACLACDAGTYASSSGLSRCVNCTAGSFSSGDGSDGCEDCPVGTYSAADGASACDSCPAGQFQDESGMSVCELCSTGSSNSYTGQASCSPCRAGTYANTTEQTACERCAAGSYSAASASACTDCAAGRFGSVAGLDTCVDCPVGFVGAVEGLTACEACTPGRHSPAARGLECVDCIAGRSAPGYGAQVCEVCGLGTYAVNESSATCDDCPPGSYQNSEGQDSCTPCAPGSFARSSGQAVCVECSVGFYTADSGASACEACDAGSAQASTGQTSCDACSTGRAVGASGQAVCAECDSGSYANRTGLTACEDCAIGRFSQQSALGRGATVCSECAAGTYVGAVGQPLCLPCAFGTLAALPGASACDDCAAGKYADFGGATACVSCDEGSFSLDGFVECELCGTGTYANATGQTECQPCPRGAFETDTGSSECSQCEAGTFASVGGSLLCDQCEPGTAAPDNGSLACADCDVGYYQDDFGSTTCKPCAVGSFSAASRQRRCELCEPGFYSDELGSSTCLPCLHGSFQDSFAKSACDECDPGSFTGALGQKLCELCPPGTFSNSSGTSACEQCAAGRYQDDFGQTECKPCEAGTFNPSLGQRVCSFCDVGSYTAADGMSVCEQCDQGEFQDRVGTTACRSCDIGTYMPSRGESACLSCPEGTFGNSSHATSCVGCPAGTHNPNLGRIRCDLCSPGFFSGTNQRECTVCQDGTVAPFNGTTACIPCSANSSPNFFKTLCDCDAGYFLPDHLGDETAPCVGCPVGADCDAAGVRFTTIEAAPGWWRSSLDDESFMRCLVRKHCVGGRGEFDAVSGEYLGSACRENRGGPLCGVCLDGYYETAGGDCVACPEEAGSWIFFVFIAILVVFLLWLQLYIVLRSGNDLITKSLQAEADQQMMADLALDEYSEGSYDSGSESGSESGSYYSGSESGSYSGSESGSYSRSGSGSYSQSYSQTASYTATGASHREGEGAAAAAKKGDKAHHEDQAVAAAVLADQYEVDPADSGGRRDDVLTIHGPPLPPPNFTYALKIALGFAQIITNLGSGLEIQWPSRYKEAVLYLTVVNFDFVVDSSLGCVSAFSYYRTYLVVVLTPVAGFFLIAIFYLLPRYYGWCGRSSAHAAQLRSKINFWRLFLYTLFLIYPGVSSTVLRHYVCKDIFGTSYLLTDLRVECYTDQWTVYAYASVSLVLLYPIGIPTFFYTLLRINRDHLQDDRVKAQLGFLYAGYRDATWWFEIADSFHKLFLTSILAFFPLASQLPLGMSVAILYMAVLLQVNPYVRSEDDRLHLLAQTEIFLLLMAGNVFYHMPEAELSDKEDLALSIVLLMITMLFICAFFYQGFIFARRVLRRWWNGRKAARRKALQEEEALEAANAKAAAAGGKTGAAAAAATPSSPRKGSTRAKAAPAAALDGPVLPGAVATVPEERDDDDDGSESYSGTGSASGSGSSYTDSRSRSESSRGRPALAPLTAAPRTLQPLPPVQPRSPLSPVSRNSASGASANSALPPLRGAGAGHAASSNPASPTSPGGW